MNIKNMGLNVFLIIALGLFVATFCWSISSPSLSALCALVVSTLLVFLSIIVRPDGEVVKKLARKFCVMADTA